MTIGYIIFVGLIGIIGIICSLAAAASSDYDSNGFKTFLLGLGLTVLVVVIMIVAGNWYYGSTAAGIRAVKDQESNLNNGLNREIIIEAADGRRVFYYKGKCDIESDHTDNYILFEGEDGLRRMVYYGITDTVLILETGE